MRILAALLLALSAPSSPADPLLAEMRALEAERGRAIREGDFEALGRIYAPDFRGRTAANQEVDRDTLFAIFRRNLGSPVIAESRVEGVVPTGSLVQVHGSLILREAGTGRTLSGSNFLHSFQRREGCWEMVRGTAIPFPSPPAAGPR